MSDERPYLQVPNPSESDYKLYEEWLKKQKKELEETEKEKSVIVIDI